MRIILLGAPGSGKGTQAENLMRDYGCPQISTGVLLRETIEQGTTVGKTVEEIMARGDLVSDEIVLDLIANSLEDIEDEKGYLLDGYPRNINQARSLNILLNSINRPLQHTILIDVDPEVLVKRLSGRRTCSLTGRTLNIYFSSQDELDACTNSGGELIQRDDDHIESIKKRIEVYKEQTEPMIKFYSEMGILKVIDGEGAIDEVYSRLLSQVN
ncbi:MAG TPA: adenylate kinase [Gammaproteobacteria bacterium]|jgi:adenylate kinase|nr:adenylate kinase [Gammaproteobacteria bacterium]HIK76975.1 adenylate kinase [Gammaproteobacteria bacterium]